MNETANTSASIVQFPTARASRIAPLPTAAEAARSQKEQEIQDRLARAVARLTAALAEQRTAAQALRAAVGDLHGAMSTLGRSLDGYNTQLTAVSARVGVLRQQAVQLEALAERAALPNG